MKILALDTSTGHAGLAITDGGRPLAEIGIETGARRGERLSSALAEILDGAGVTLQDMDAYAVGIGPGSFTGLRAGLAFLKGIALALPAPVAAASSLEAIALGAGFWKGQILVATDARKKEVFAALFDADGQGNLERLSEDMVMAPGRLGELACEQVLVTGDGLARYRGQIGQALGDRALLAPPRLWAPRASLVAALALPRLTAGEHDDIDSLAPRYVRDSDAQLRLGPRKE